jgi:hypothetical protein
MSDQETAEVNQDVNPEELPVGEQAAQYLKDALFGGVDRDGRDTAMGELFLALVNNQGETFDVGEPSPREQGALNAYQNWYNDVEKRLKNRYGDDPEALAGATNPDFIRQEMAREMLAQLSEMNTGAEFSEEATAKIQALMTGGPEAFAEAMGENATTVREAEAEHKRRMDAAKAAGEPTSPMGLAGLMAILMAPSEDGGATPRIYMGDIEMIDVTPEGQIEASLTAAFDGMHDFVKGGGGAERHLARIAGETWGPNAGETRGADHLKYEGINKIPGFGGVYNNDEALAAKIDEFASRSGLLEHEDYALTDTSSPGAANMDNLFIKPMEERGQISFGKEGATSTEIEAARAAWKAELVDALKDKLPKDEFRERMERFAAERSDITLENEATPEAGMTQAEWEASVDALVEYDAGREGLVASVEVAAAYPIAEHVVNFDAVRAEGDMSMETVPVVMAGLNATQTPMPEMGYGMQADGLAVNSPHDPRLGMNLGVA